MAKLSAEQVVDKMLEDFDFSNPEHKPAGSPQDPWRQAGIKKLDFKAKDFLKHEPGKAPGGKKVPINKGSLKQSSRFKWSPKQI